MVRSLVYAFFLMVAVVAQPLYGQGNGEGSDQAVMEESAKQESRNAVLEKPSVDLHEQTQNLRVNAEMSGVDGKNEEHLTASQESGKKVEVGPQLEYVEPNYDFGKVEMGTVIRHTFIYRNTGDKDLIIYYGKGGCTCVKVEYEKDTIAPGGTGEVTMIFDTSNRIGKEGNTIFLQANTPQKIHRARFKGEIVWPEGKDPTKRNQ